MVAFSNMAAIFGIAGLVLAAAIYNWVSKQSDGNDLMRKLAGQIHEGAMVFLKREYKILAIFVVVVFVLLSVAISVKTGIAFIVGAICSVLAGFFGMNSATKANVRTAAAANSGAGQAGALSMAFFGGTVMGLSVASLGLLGVGALFWYFDLLNNASNVTIISGFSMGASSIALFARVGGGIFTKTADVGADLVGKVEANIPEDDPRNPAVIADNVGDCVGGRSRHGRRLVRILRWRHHFDDIHRLNHRHGPGREQLGGDGAAPAARYDGLDRLLDRHRLDEGAGIEKPGPRPQERHRNRDGHIHHPGFFRYRLAGPE